MEMAVAEVESVKFETSTLIAIGVSFAHIEAILEIIEKS